ncbi:MAG: protein kinase, partial [Polyangiaceae bacterium]|nr:protein kinase [Polyangiaceae bacterium]
MRQGQVVDGRFEIERPAGTGGMATVYRARDRTTGRPVALKLLGAGDPSAVARFEHEGRILARISHARVVQYVAHGVLDGGEPYLAMEWLEGESLAERLARGPLLVGESLAVARATAEALAAAHAQGVIHRDIKPSNLFLVGGEVEGLRVLDFGIARMARTVDGRLTQSGSVMGTPGYMAPEQASGEQDRIGARSDVFSLGAVLFECLTGRPAFEGKHVMAVLAKLLREEAPRVRDMRPELPPEIDALVAWMMAKDPEQRPRDGAEVAAALDALADPLQRATAADPTLAEAITDRELRLVSIVAASAPWAEDPGLEESTLDGATSRRLLDPIVAAAAPDGARLDEISGGTLLLSLAGTGDALDLAARAARCALRVRDLLAGSPVVIATGRAERGGGLPVGPVVDRAAALLASAPPRDARVPPRAVACPTVGAPGRAPRGGAPSAPNPLAMDDVTRALLDVRFEIEATERGAFLIGERDIGRHVRTLLGRPSPCVGRDRELRNLRELVEESLDEPAARVVLITGPAGIGKSRLRHELLEDLQRARPEAAIMIGRGDSMSAGSPLSLLGSAFRSAAGITGGEPKPAQRDKLLSLVERWCAADGPRIAGFLGELVGTPFPDETHPKLAAARGAPALMAEQILRAFLDFMAAWCAAGPRVLVLEDGHWADAAAIKLVDRALGELRGAPLVTLG